MYVIHFFRKCEYKVSTKNGSIEYQLQNMYALMYRNIKKKIILIEMRYSNYYEHCTIQYLYGNRLILKK